MSEALVKCFTCPAILPASSPSVRSLIMRLDCDGFRFKVLVGLDLRRGMLGANCLWQNMKLLSKFDNISFSACCNHRDKYICDVH